MINEIINKILEIFRFLDKINPLILIGIMAVIVAYCLRKIFD